MMPSTPLVSIALIPGINRKLMLQLILVIGLLVLSTGKSIATHAAGAELTYRCLGGMVYEVDAIFYRDCGGTPEPGNMTLTYKSGSCSYTRTALAIKVTGPNGEEITTPCNTSPSSCNGGFTTGIRKWVYRAVITLPFACSDWTFSYRVCCRNCVVTTIQSPCSTGSELYVEAGLNNITAPCNSSPVYGNSPIAFVCLGQNFNYNQGTYDIDGDSLAYELITPKTSATSEVSWISPASAQSPLASSTPFTIDAITGDINFTPSLNQIGVMAIRVNEFRNGQWIGSTIRDMQVYTQNCFNTIPFASGINGTNSHIINACAGQQLCFTINTSDNDLSQNVSVTWNNPIQGAVITQTAGPRPQLEFCWTPTAADVNRIPKSFTIIVRDDACPLNGTQSFAYSIFVGHSEVSVNTTNPQCAGLSTGSATVVGNSAPGYTYSWTTTPPQTGNAVSGLIPGSYSVIATSPEGCTATETFVIDEPSSPMVATAVSTGIIMCNSGNIGIAEVVITGGYGPYSFLWSNGATTNQISALGAGNYTVTVTDANGCTAVSSTTIAQSTGLINASFTNVSMSTCMGSNNGSATVNATGGSTPYSYVWSHGASSQTVDSLPAGNYVVTVSDVAGCTTSLTLTITEPQIPLVAQVSNVNHVNCFGGDDGALNLTISGGAGLNTIQWSNGAIGSGITNLSAGTYTFTVTDQNGCIATGDAVINEPASPLNVSLSSITHVQCAGDLTGTIQLSATGGAGNYSYIWNNSSVTSGQTALAAGNYSVTVTDQNGCTDTLSAMVTEPELPITIVVAQVSHIVCNQSIGGSITVNAVGGTGPLSYQWSNGSTSLHQNGLVAGTYTLTVTDANGCSQQSVSEIRNLINPVVISANHIQHVLCFNMSNGFIDIDVNGGVAPFHYLWSNGSQTQDLQNLTAGNYFVTVTDSNGCQQQSSFTVLQPSSPLIPVVISDSIACFGGTATMALQINGGTSPYTYLWNNGQTSSTLNNVTAGSYTVTVTDANGCNAIISQELHQPGTPVVGNVVVIDNINCYGGNNGSVRIHAAGGTAPYTFLWSNGAVSDTLFGLTTGTYSVVITDFNGCTHAENVFLNQPMELELSGAVTNSDCLQNLPGSISLTATGGSAPYTYVWNDGSTGQNHQQLVPGTYHATVTDANGCSSDQTFTVDGNSSFNFLSDTTIVICVGETATLSVDSIAGTNYQWYYEGNILNGATGFSFTTPAAGYYHLTATNECGVFTSDSILVDVKSIGNVAISNMQIICPPETASLFASGGTSYQWNPDTYISFTNIPNPVVSPPMTTTYQVEISNEYGCKTTLSTNVAVVCDSLLVPTGFSPNDDGVNDGYVIDGIADYPGNKLWVYNRYGRLVYKATDYTNSWDGVSNVSGLFMGKKLPTGTYFYILDLNDRSKPRAGFIVLRR